MIQRMTEIEINYKFLNKVLILDLLRKKNCCIFCICLKFFEIFLIAQV